jgi:LysM repeat protein
MPKHTVKTGDTIYGIANTYGVIPDAILKINPKFTYLKPGMVVDVPGTRGKIKIPKINTIPKVSPGTVPAPKYNLPQAQAGTASTGNRIATPGQLAQVTQAVPGTRGNIGYNGGITMYAKEKEMRDVLSTVSTPNRPILISSDLVKLIDRYYPATNGLPANGVSLMAANGYTKNPITGNWVLTGTPMGATGVANPPTSSGIAGIAGTSATAGVTGTNTSGLSGNYLAYLGYGNQGGGIDSAFVGQTSAMGGLSQSGYNQKSVPFSKTPWADRYKGRTDTTPPTSTSPKPPTTYSNNYVSYGVGLIHWRV